MAWQESCTATRMSHFTPHPLSDHVIGAAIEVHRAIGPGLLESAYDQCLAYELASRGVGFRRQIPLPVIYKGVSISCGYRVDYIIENEVLVELKAADRLLAIHHAQVLTYLRLLKLRRALLINFNVPRLVDGVKSVLNGWGVDDAGQVLNHENTKARSSL